jgi:hypothetical protein
MTLCISAFPAKRRVRLVYRRLNVSRVGMDFSTHRSRSNAKVHARQGTTKTLTGEFAKSAPVHVLSA